MPSTSAKQHQFMEAVAHSPGFAKKAGVAQKVGRDFAKADDRAGITKTHGGKPVKKWEGSKADEAADRKGAKKAGVSMKKWEGSAADRKVDARAQRGSPKSAEAHMTKRRGHGATFREIGGEHGVAPSTAHRKVMQRGFVKLGSAKA